MKPRTSQQKKELPSFHQMSPLAQLCTKIECAWKSCSLLVFRETNGISWLRMENIPLGISIITLPLSLFVMVWSGVAVCLYQFHMRQTHPPNHRRGRWRNILWYQIMKIQGIPITKYFQMHAQFLPAAALHQVYGTRPWAPHTSLLGSSSLQSFQLDVSRVA